MQTKLVNQSPFSELIYGYFNRSFVNSSIKGAELLDVLTNILLGTKENRYGSIPTPESLVKVRAVITNAIEKKFPIPVVVPWGAIKADLTGAIDIAEVSGIKQLIKLNKCVEEHFSPGLDIHLRIEDVNANWLYRKRNVAEAVNEYTDSLKSLVYILDEEWAISVNSESGMMDQKEYNTISSVTSAHIMEYLKATTPVLGATLGSATAYKAYDKLREATGWVGEIPYEMRDYYLSRYRADSVNPIEGSEAVERLADYLGGSRARYVLKGTADTFTDGGGPIPHLKFSFTPPVPGVPLNLAGTNLYYRTVNYSDARTHIPAWRARGFLQIQGGNNIKAKIASFNDERLEHLEHNMLELSRDNTTVQIQADVLVTD